MKSNLETLAGYKNRIVDLSRRNRLLKFPKNAKSILFELGLEELLSRFGTLDDLTIEFVHRQIFDAEDDKANINQQKEKKAFIPPTNPEGEKLIDMLNGLRLETKRKFEEHGLHTLFLAIGQVKWKEPGVGSRRSGDVVEGHDYNAPLLLVPIIIEEKKLPKKTVITTHLETCDITVNKVLSLLLEKEYNARSLVLDHKSKDAGSDRDWANTYNNLCTEVESIFGELKIECEISHEILIGQYSFLGQQIYEDLHCNEDGIIKHEFINALCTHTQLQQDSLDIDVENPDCLLSAENDFNVMDADKSQLEVVQQVINGSHLNIQGPPGTGKSQTIVNLISNLLAREKTVLVVCEKNVALEVVLERLKKTGLDKLCLPLFQHNADKKIFAKSVIEDRAKVIRYDEFATDKQLNLKTPLTERSKRIDELRSYAAALNQTVSPLNRSLYWVHGEFSRHRTLSADKAIPWKGSDPLQINFEEYTALMNILEGITPLYNIAQDKDLSHWKTIKKQYFSPDFVARLNRVLGELRKSILSIDRLDSVLASFDTLADIRKLFTNQKLVSESRVVGDCSVIETDLRRATTMLANVLEHIDIYNNLHNNYFGKYAIPINWDHRFVNAPDDYISNAAKISQVRAAALSSTLLKARLDLIQSLVQEIDEVGITRLEELLSYKDILQLDPVVKKLQNSSNAAALRSAAEQLKELLRIYNRFNKAQKVCDKWAIAFTEVDIKAGLLLCNQFENKYGSILRYFYPQYRKDCRLIAAWCDADEKPRSYNEYFELVQGVKDYFKFQNALKESLAQFNQSWVCTGSVLDSHQIPLLFNNVNKLLDWLNTQGQEQLPAGASRLMFDSTKLSALGKLYAAVDDVYALLNSSWNIFTLSWSRQAKTIADVTYLYPLLLQSIENKLELYKAVSDVYREKINDCAIGDLKKDALEIDKLFSAFELLKKFSAHFGDNNALVAAIGASEPSRNLQAQLKRLVALVDLRLHPLPANVTIVQAQAYSDELCRLFPRLLNWHDDYCKLVAELNALFGSENSLSHIEEQSFPDFIKTLDVMLSDHAGLEKWMTYRRYSYQLQSKGYGWFLQATRDNKSIISPASLFAQALWGSWLEAYYAKNPVLQNFSPKEHARIIDEFKKLEEKILKYNSFRIFENYAAKFQRSMKLAGEEEKLLVHQSELKMRHKPIRRLVKEIGNQLLKYKPCWMMSPLTLSSYIPYGSLNFDVVIFDEASQMRVEHCLGAIARASQVLIFGDENQLPPTSFFEVSSDGEDDDDGMVEDYESILHATKEILPGANCLLSHHYRSKYEDLIAFSNHYVYNDQLITFPNPSKVDKAVVFEFVQEGLFDGGKGGSRRNDAEARRVVELCVRHVTSSANTSLGVIAFSKAQEVGIRDALHEYLKKNPQQQQLLDETSDSHAPFFIKNLESVQGDERDVIILSVGYGRDKRTGEMYNRFGPINTQHGYRRLNVAVTRAKEKVICVSSIRSTDIRNADKSRGPLLLQKYLEYAERGIESLDASLLIQNQRGIELDSPFEEDVERALQERGYVVHRQVGASGYKIDLAIVDSKNDQKYVLGIECDGASYHSSYSARMNDRIRQAILERLGWKLYRIWSQHWISHKEDIIEDIIQMVASHE